MGTHACILSHNYYFVQFPTLAVNHKACKNIILITIFTQINGVWIIVNIFTLIQERT